MTNFAIIIVPNLILKSGKHTIRISVNHNGQTRYIPTNVVIDDASQFKNGRIIKREDKDILNIKLRKELNKYEERYDSISYADALTCSQLVKMLRSGKSPKEIKTFAALSQEFLSQIDKEDRTKTEKLYRLASNKFIDYAGKNIFLEEITPIRVTNYVNWLAKKGLSHTTINIYYTLFKVIINYAIKMHYVRYDVSPFVTAKVPRATKRETQITVDELRRIRDMKCSDRSINVVRDIFMLTYYLAGMNLVDMLDYVFLDAKEINYVRRKTRNTKEGDNVIRFTIPDEAIPMIQKYLDHKTGKLSFGHYKTYVSLYNVMSRKMNTLAVYAKIGRHITLYSARKSFVQHGFDLGIPLSTLEYCIGQSMKEERPIFNYVSIMKKHADKAIREVLDNLKK